MLIVREKHALAAILPFYIYPDSHSGDRQLLLAGAGTSDYLDGIFSPACTSEQLAPALRSLASEGGWDRAFLSQLPVHSLLSKALAGHATPAISEPCCRRPTVPMRALPQKLRAEVLYQKNAASSLGKLSLIYATERIWEQTFDLLVRFHTERWEKAGQPGVLADPYVLAHHRQALPILLASGVARLCTLHAGEQTLGVLYSLLDPIGHENRTEYFYLMGFAPGHAKLKPGLLLLAFAMEQAAQDGVSYTDMLRGDESYKKFWRMEPVQTQGFTCTPKELRRTLSAFPALENTSAGQDFIPLPNCSPI